MSPPHRARAEPGGPRSRDPVWAPWCRTGAGSVVVRPPRFPAIMRLMRPVLALTLMASAFYAADLRIDHVTHARETERRERGNICGRGFGFVLCGLVPMFRRTGTVRKGRPRMERLPGWNMLATTGQEAAMRLADHQRARVRSV
jgi:hypothetical protein